VRVTVICLRTLSESSPVTQHVVHVTSLTPNREYVFRVASAADTTFTNVNVSCFDGFTTKLSNPSVQITAPAENEAISSVASVEVHISDPASNPPDSNVAKLELYVDGVPTSSFSHTQGTDTYLFSVDTSTLGSGFHQLEARVADNSWKESNHLTNVLVSQSGMQSLMTSGSSSKMLAGVQPAAEWRRGSFGAVILCGKDVNPYGLPTSWTWLINKAAKQEKVNYEKRYISPAHIVHASDIGNDARVRDYIVEAWKDNEAFSYIGHGENGAIVPDPNTGGTDADELQAKRQQDYDSMHPYPQLKYGRF